jgi:AGCS family alanine or glycine:cation symporter
MYLVSRADLGFIWLLADPLNALVAVPNLIALILLSPVVFKLTREIFDSNGLSDAVPAEAVG